MKDLLEGTKNACQCVGCGKVFTSTSAFDKHRTGKPDNRRCLTTDEMIEKRMECKTNGRWGTIFTGQFKIGAAKGE